MLESIADVSARSQLPLLLDTNIYILDASGKLPDTVATFIERSRLFHCTICLSEIATGIANAAPARGWSAIRDHYAAVFEAIPAHRLLVPAAEVWIDAGLIAGTLARVQDFQRAQLKECLNDALIFLTAARRHSCPDRRPRRLRPDPATCAGRSVHLVRSLTASCQRDQTAPVTPDASLVAHA